MASAIQRIREAVARLIALIVFRGPVVLTAGRARVIFDPRTGRLVPVIAGADGEGEGEGGWDGEGAGDGEGSGDGSGAGDGDGEGDGGDADGAGDGGSDDDKTDWKAMARKHERRAKAEKKRADDLAAEQKKIDDANKSEQERAVETAREEGRTAALTEAQKERRADRLEVAVTRLAARGIKVKDGDTEKTLRFEDPEDALVFIERAIAKGDLDEDDVFDENHKVKLDDIEVELAALLERKPRLAAGTNGGGEGERRAAGGADGGRGKGAGTGIEDMSVEDHIKRKQLANK